MDFLESMDSIDFDGIEVNSIWYWMDFLEFIGFHWNPWMPCIPLNSMGSIQPHYFTPLSISPTGGSSSSAAGAAAVSVSAAPADSDLMERIRTALADTAPSQAEHWQSAEERISGWNNGLDGFHRIYGNHESADSIDFSWMQWNPMEIPYGIQWISRNPWILLISIECNGIQRNSIWYSMDFLEFIRFQWNLWMPC